MLFDSDPIKQATEAWFSHKRDNVSHEPLAFDNNKIKSAPAQKYLGLILDSELAFKQHIDDKINKYNKILGIMNRLSMAISRKSFLIIYISFVRPHLDYADITYDRPCNESLKGKIEAVQYNAFLAITGAIRGTYWERLCRELGLETLNDHKLLFFHKIIKGFSPSCLQKFL